MVDEHYQTSIPGIFSAGNVLHVHDLADFVSLEAEALADSVLEFCSVRSADAPLKFPARAAATSFPKESAERRMSPSPSAPATPCGDASFPRCRTESRIASKRLPRANPRGDGAVHSIPASVFLSQSPIKVVLQDD